MEKILLAYGLLKEIVKAMTMLERNTKFKVPSSDGDTDYFDIVAGVLQGDTSAPYLLIISQAYVILASIDLLKENGFTLKGPRSRRYLTETIRDADYADDITLLVNTPAQAKSLWHSMEQAAGGIGFHVNANKTMYICFKCEGAISTQNVVVLKLVDNLTYLGGRVSSTDSGVNRSYESLIYPIKIKRDLFLAAFVSILRYGCTTWTLTRCIEKELDKNCTRVL